MTIAMCEPRSTPTIKTVELVTASELVRGQLVRGQDERLLEQVGPLVLDRSVTLDLASVERIDAAGITALLALYRSARESGHRFSLTNVSARVAQILAVVGLDRLLLSHNAVQNLHCGQRMRRPAA